MLTNKVLHITIYCFLLHPLIYAQVNYEEIAELSQGVGEQFSCEIDYKLFKQGDQQVREHLSGNYAQDENGAYFNVANTEYLWFSGENLIINHDVQIMILRDQQKQSIPDHINYDLYEEFTDTIYKTHENQRSVTYVMNLKNLVNVDYSKIELKLDKVNKQPLEVELYFKDKINFSKSSDEEDWGVPHISIHYQNFSKAFSDYNYDMSRFFEKKENEVIELNPPYTNYEMHNLKQQGQ